MKQSEIKVGKVYQGRGGKLRRVLEIRKDDFYTDVIYINIPGQHRRAQYLPTFAEWAKGEVKDG